jgi:transcriptional regulator with XRE-family HTH domain
LNPAESSRSNLAERLFQLRKEAGLTGDQLAATLGWDKAGRTKVSKIENGRQVPTPAEVTGWANAAGHPEQADELLDLLAELVTVHTQWRRRLREGQAVVQQDIDRRTRAATRFRNVEIALIPGLLQTSGYARAIGMMVSAVYGTRDLDAYVQARMQRQDVLYDPSKVFEFIIAEAALRSLPCPKQVMLGQLDRLLSLGLENVTLGILPQGAELTVLPFSSFLLLDDDLTIETWAGKIEEHAGEQVAVSHRIFGMLMAEALTGDEARRLIMAVAEGLRKG